MPKACVKRLIETRFFCQRETGGLVSLRRFASHVLLGNIT